MVPLAITICCMGNEYPAQSYGLGLEEYNQRRQMEQMRYEMDYQRNQQRFRDDWNNSCRPGSYCYAG